MIEALGWIGGILLALCCVPQAIQVWKTKSVEDFNWGFLLMWFFGEVFSGIYLLYGNTFILPVFINYLLNIACLLLIISIKVR